MSSVSTHNPRNQEVFNIIRNNLPIIEEDPDMKKILETSQIIKSKRRNPSLKCILNRASFSSKNPGSPIIKKCDKPRCSKCTYLTEGSTFQTRKRFNSQNLSVVHQFKSYLCDTLRWFRENYIGQTRDTFRHRMTVHRQQFREPKYQCTPVSEHIRNCAQKKVLILPFSPLQISEGYHGKRK